MKPVRGRETLLLENGDAEGNVGITSNHRLSGFGQRKSADGDSANAGLGLSDHPDVLPMDGFLRCGAASCALIILYQFAL